MAVRLRGGRVHRRLQRQSDPLPLPRQHHQNPLDTDTGGRHQRLTYGHDTWRARCVERRTPGSAGGPQKPARGNPGAALRSDPTAGLCPGRGPSGPAPSGDGRLTEEGRDAMEVMFGRVAGLDVGKETVTVCLRTPGLRGRRHAETRTFKTMSASLRVMRDWLVEVGVSIAA